MDTPLWTIVLFIIVSAISAVATFLVKISAPKITRKLKRLLKNWQFFLGIFLYGCSTVLSIAALRYGELSVLYPFVALQYVWANLLSKRFLGEELNVYKWLGVALIFVGVTLIGVGA